MGWSSVSQFNTSCDTSLFLTKVLIKTLLSQEVKVDKNISKEELVFCQPESWGIKPCRQISFFVLLPFLPKREGTGSSLGLSFCRDDNWNEQIQQGMGLTNFFLLLFVVIKMKKENKDARGTITSGGDLLVTVSGGNFFPKVMQTEKFMFLRSCYQLTF